MCNCMQRPEISIWTFLNHPPYLCIVVCMYVCMYVLEAGSLIESGAH